MEALIRHGGLGVGNIKIKNLGLLAKWWWRFTNNKESLWKRVTKSCHNLISSKPSLKDLEIIESVHLQPIF